jgi:diacylglycerol kinase family enzyme
LRNALLVYNPESGRRRQARLRDVESVRAALTAGGVNAQPLATTGPATAARQVTDALAQGFDTLIVCAGDGTINEVLPAIVNTPAALGVVPLGTANVLANDLGIPRNPAVAAKILLSAAPRSTPLVRMDYADLTGQPRWRYFIAAAGIGADAQLVYALTAAFKQRWGMAAYYAEASRQWATHSFPLFAVEFTSPDGRLRRETVSQVLAVRITWFGGMLKRLAPGAALHRPGLQLVLFKTRRRLHYLRYMLGVWLERPWTLPEVELVPATSCRCLPLDQNPPLAIAHRPSTIDRIYAEADGELLGTLPVSITMTSDSVNLLVPNKN